MNVNGKILVFVNEGSYFNEKGVAIPFNKYSTTISKKDKETGEYSNAYMEVKFSELIRDDYELNDLEEGDSIDVDISEGFISFREWENKDGVSIKSFQVIVTGVRDIVRHEKKEVPYTEKSKAPQKKTTTKKSLKK